MPPDPTHHAVSVREAAPPDAAAIARVQEVVWRQSYAQLLGDAASSAFDTVGAQQSWGNAITNPPGRTHRILVATDGDTVVGFAAYAPGADPDLDSGTDAELLVFHVDPAHTRVGHGSRLMAAAVDHARADGFTRLITWVFAADDPLRAFLRSTGWEADGSTRDLDVGELVHQVRLHTVIEPPGDIIA